MKQEESMGIIRNPCSGHSFKMFVLASSLASITDLQHISSYFSSMNSSFDLFKYSQEEQLKFLL